MLKHLTLGASIAAVALSLAASAAFAADKPVYGVLMKTLSNPFWGAMEKGVDAGAKNAGVDIFLDAVESDQAAEPQLNACNTMLQKKPAAMITAAINSTILLPCLKQANEMKIPVVDLDNNLDPGDHQEGRRRGRLPYRLRQRGGGRRRPPTIWSACSARTRRGRFW